MRRPTLRGIFARYAAAWGYVAAVTIAESGYALLPARSQAELLSWASTSVHNLQHDPVGCLVASAFFPAESLLAWPALIALALFGACHVLGSWRTLAVCGAAQVLGTLVSEGIVDDRVTHGSLPASARFYIDVGPSYVVVAAIAVAILYGPWLARAAAAADLAILTFIGGIFWGVGSLQVAPVGHVTALCAGIAGGTLAAWRLRRRRQAASAAVTPAGLDREASAAQPRPPA
jgi:hypothetical protein